MIFWNPLPSFLLKGYTLTFPPSRAHIRAPFGVNRYFSMTGASGSLIPDVLSIWSCSLSAFFISA